MPTLLFVDDDQDFLNLNSVRFKKLGYSVICAADAREALKVISEVVLDCVILDIDMPGEDGVTVCKRLRERSALPVIFLSALTQEEVRVKSFHMGGDDYMAKPYYPKELEMRILARIKSHAPHTEVQTLRFGQLEIDAGLREVRYGGQRGRFTSLQFDLLFFLSQNPGQVFSYQRIYDGVWNAPIMGCTHNLHVITATVRQKLAALCEGKRYIETIPRKGYRFVYLTDPEEEDGSGPNENAACPREKTASL